AHDAGRRVALTLSDPAWVDLHRDRFVELLDHVDIVFANEAEARSLLGVGDALAAAEQLRSRCEAVAVTRGEHGSVVASVAGIRQVPAGPVTQVVDLTGAGDLYAAGFLLGLTRGMAP